MEEQTTPMTRFVEWAAKQPGQEDKTGRQAAADLLGVSYALVCHMLTGERGVSVAVANMVHQLTGGQVSRDELRPDIFGPPPAPGRAEAA